MMKWISVLAVLAVWVGASARADDKQAFLGVFAETSAMKTAGMPAMPQMPQMPQLPAGMKPPPGLAAMMSAGRPSRKLVVRLWSPGIAPDGATASLAIPDGLKLGPKLDLSLYRPKPEEGKETTAAAPGDQNAMPTEFTIKRYWGSSPTVKPGQPEVIHFGDLSPEMKAMIRSRAQRRPATSSYFYKPDWTTGYWPAEGPATPVAPDAAMPGHYALTTTYTGNVEIDVPSEVSFLDPVEMTSPDLTQQIPFDQPMAFQWKPIPNLLGSYARITGMIGRNTIIIWSSSEIRTDLGISFDYMQMADVKDAVKSTAMMGPDRKDVTVPAGIFQDCDFVSMQMIGYGPGTALEKAQPLPRVQTKTTLTVMLGGKMMRGMGGAPPGAPGGQ
jgi:hypothetical protein